MPVATTHTVALNGALGHLIDVQADVSPGQVNVTMVGRGDAALREGQDRIRMAIINSGLRWPATKRITLLLSPADLPKSGTHFDLALAVAVLAADGALGDDRRLAGVLFIGELTLSGGLRPAVGVLPMVLAAAERGIHRVFVPEPQQDEARMVPGLRVDGVRSLAQVVAMLLEQEPPDAPPVAASSGTQLLTWRGEERLDELDLADLHGLVDTKYALEVAAAGGHPLLLSGPKGSGKTSVAERIPTILPDLTPEESLELTAVHSLAGVLDPADGHARPAAVRRAPPRREQGQHRGRRQQPGASGRDQPGSLRGALSGRVPAVPLRRHRRAPPAARERGHHDRPARGVGPPAGPRAARARREPVPLWQLLGNPGRQPLQLR